jgi:uncharacterized protein YcnI
MPKSARFAVVFAAALLALSLGAGPALAHEEITPTTIQTGTPTFLTLAAANEKEAPITKVEVTLPDGAEVGETTRTPAGWKASRTESGVAWTGGKVEPETFEQWGFELEGADQPGTLTFTVTLTAGGDTEQVRVPVTAAATKGAGTAPAAPATTAAALASADSNSSGAEGRATLALWLALGGLLLGVAALIITLTRRGGAPPSTSTPAAPQDF